MHPDQLIFGLHAVTALLQQQPDRILRLCVLRERDDKRSAAVLSLAQAKHIPIEYCTRTELDKMLADANHQGFIAHCKRSKVFIEADLNNLLDQLTEPPFLLILDGVQDPHNLGACLRSAEAAGVHAVLAPKDKSVGLTPVVSKVASGAAEVIPFIQVTNLARTMELLKERGIWFYGAAGEAEQDLFTEKLTGPIAIVLGGEGTGLRRLTRDRCDKLLKIPMAGSVSSLNVSVAAGVFLFEVVRQRSLKK